MATKQNGRDIMEYMLYNTDIKWPLIAMFFYIMLKYLLYSRWKTQRGSTALKCRSQLHVDLVAEDLAAEGPYHFIPDCPVMMKTNNEIGFISSYDEITKKYWIRKKQSHDDDHNHDHDQQQHFLLSQAMITELHVPTIQDLIIYPIKSCAGIRLSRANTYRKCRRFSIT